MVLGRPTVLSASPNWPMLFPLPNSTQTGFNFELKPRAAGRRRDTLIENVEVALRSFANKDKLLISSFDHDLLRAVREAMPEVPLAWLCTPAEVRAGSWREASPD